MEQNQVTLNEIYLAIQKMQEELKKIDEKLQSNSNDWENIESVADVNLLAESWLSKEDEEAFAYLQ